MRNMAKKRSENFEYCEWSRNWPAMCLYRARARVCVCVCENCVHWRPAAHRLIRSSWLLFFFGLFFIVVLRSIQCSCTHRTHRSGTQGKRITRDWRKKQAPHHIRAFCKFKRVPDTSMRLLGNFSLFSLFTSNECVFLFIWCFFFSFVRSFV